MGWEARNGGTYYYAKERVGGRVVSKYLGGGLDAQAAAEQVAELRALAAEHRHREQAQRRAVAAVDAMLRQTDAAIGQVVRELLCLTGLHQHKGTWRRKRHDRQASPQ